MRTLFFFSVCGAALLLQGCPPLGSTTFVNKTGGTITVRYADKTISVPADASNTTRGYVWPQTFEIDTPRHTWHYANVYVGRDFMYPTFDVVLRIDGDGRVYASQPPEASKKFSEQPPGYPLRPKA
jgi:hypothetical protein